VPCLGRRRRLDRMSTAEFITPRAFEPLWRSDCRFIGAHGGRGSGKSWDRALHLLMRVTQETMRVACVREVQNSIRDSVRQLLVDTIQRQDVGHLFQLTENEIRSANGSVIIFRGMADQNAETIKSMENVKIVWWEEAQTASQRSIDLLRPTVRAPGSQIWFTWNPRRKSDPVDQLLRQGGIPDEHKTVVQANWYDNPHFPPELELERQIDMEGDPDRYAHIWEGAYEEESDTQFIGGGLVRAAQQRRPWSELGDPLILGVDVARFGDDVSVIYPRRGFDAATVPYQVYKRLDTMQLASRVAEMAARHHADAVFVDEGGVGAGVVDRLRQLNVNCIGVNFGAKSDHGVPGLPKAANKRAEIWGAMREALRSGLAIPDDQALEADLTGPLYSFTPDNAIQLEKKEDMRKRGVKSPDIADALALTWAYPVTARALQEREEAREEAAYDPVWGSL